MKVPCREEGSFASPGFSMVRIPRIASRHACREMPFAADFRHAGPARLGTMVPTPTCFILLARTDWRAPKKWREMALFRGPKAPFSMLGAGTSKHKPLVSPLLCRPTFWRPRAREMSGAISGEGLFRRDAARPCTPRDATNLRACLRHKDAAQTAHLPRRAVSLYLDASVYAGLREHNHATH